ncbi:MAG TPA: ribokinase [Opitutaceae bacterium]
MSRPSVVVVGSSNTDMILRVERIPVRGETILGGAFATAAGGKGANQAVGAARAGGKVALVARLGRDMFGDQALAGFARDGIDVTQVVRDDRFPSGVAFIFVASDGENSIGVASGANARLTPGDVRRAQNVFSHAKVVVAQLEVPLAAVTAAAVSAEKAGAQFILNPAPACAVPDALLRRVTVLTPNETEAELLTGIRVVDEASASKAAARLRRRGARNVIVTLGSKGAWVATERGETMIAGFRVKTVDTTAAGDIFNGALAVALAEGQPLERAAQFANAAGALSVTRLGAQDSAPNRRQIERLLAR